MMRVTVFGMGHVGLVTAALLAEGGHQVAGVDVDRARLNMLIQGQMPFFEPGLEQIVRAQMVEGRLTFSSYGAETSGASDIVLICVGTPADAHEPGEVDLSAVFGALAMIAQGVAVEGDAPVVVLRSTVPPKILNYIRDYMKRFGLPHLCVNPEFLREGSAVADFRYPPLVVIGTDDERAREAMLELYLPFNDPFFGWEDDHVVFTDCRTAMLVKYVSNAWHALKVTFANEVGDVARVVGVEPGELMRIFAQDTTLNISAAYLRPGAPYGGSCLPKDLAALLTMTESALPLLRSVKESNTLRIQRLFQDALHARSVGLVGLSFKRGTDDLRDSPWVEVLRMLVTVGVAVRVYDPDVPRSWAGQYAQYLCENFDELEGWAECLIVGKPDLLPPDARLPERVIYGDGR